VTAALLTETRPADPQLPGSAGRPSPPRRHRRLDRALSLLLGAVLLAGAAAIAAGLAGIRLLVIESGSMAPTLFTGDLVVSRSVPAAGIRPGDIVTFQHPALHVPVTHRVVDARTADGSVQVTTKGDANIAAENWRIPATGQVGQAVLRVPAAGRLLRASTGRLVRAAAILLAFGYLALRMLRRIWQPA
jgi:signal peptidase